MIGATKMNDSAAVLIDRGTTWPEAAEKMITDDEEEETANDFDDEDENDDFYDDEFDRLAEHQLPA